MQRSFVKFSSSAVTKKIRVPNKGTRIFWLLPAGLAPSAPSYAGMREAREQLPHNGFVRFIDCEVMLTVLNIAERNDTVDFAFQRVLFLPCFVFSANSA